jgi:hypothetical protein
MEKVDEEAPQETPAEKLNRNLHKALDRHDEILSHHIDPYGDPGFNKLIADTSATTINSSIRVSEDRLLLKPSGDRMPSARLLAAVERAEALGRADAERAAEKAAREAARLEENRNAAVPSEAVGLPDGE